MDNGLSTFALTNSASGFDPAGDQPALVFTKSENEYQLSEIWESNMDGRELPGLSRTRQIGRADAPADEVAFVVHADLK
jgi:hypothetical protein